MSRFLFGAMALGLWTLPLGAQYAGQQPKPDDEAGNEQPSKSPWELTAGLSGSDTLNSAASAETFYWGPYGRVGYEINDPMKARLGVRNTQNKFLYDGLGGIVKQ